MRMHMRLFVDFNPKRWLVVVAAVASSLVFMPGSYVLAAEDPAAGTAPTTSAASDTTASNDNNQAATAGDAATTNNPATSPEQTPATTADNSTPVSKGDTAVTSPSTIGSDDGAPASTPSTSDGTLPVANSCVNPNTPATQPSDNQIADTQPATTAASAKDTTTTTLNNNLCSSANSGNASVNNNGIAGDATTGDAQSVATIINILQSITGLSGGKLATFIQNVYGDQFGDIHIDPTTLNYLLNSGCSLCSGGGSVNTTNNGQINNDIYLGANSGNADVSNNGLAGNATTGDATALLNLINIINSAIVANESFVGVINIYGNLNGDILFPPDLLNSLFGSNQPDGGTNSGPGSGNNVNVNNDQAINNNINLEATSGDATVADNHHAGDATTGNASTNLTIYNLTGNQVIGKNALLVFVNVLGKWVGMILNAPAGATSAALGNDVTNTICPCGGGLDANINNTAAINNNIYLSAHSGNASVIGNHRAGRATTGNAMAAANIVNIVSSQLSFSDWFGILFINVLGTWNGSFGIDTPAGNLPMDGSPTGTVGNVSDTAAPQVVEAAVVAASGKVYYAAMQLSGSQDGGDNSQQNTKHNVLGASTNSSRPAGSAKASTGGNMAIGVIGGLCCFAILGAVERRLKSSAQQGQVAPTIIQPTL